jgi:hypothetical protein
MTNMYTNSTIATLTLTTHPQADSHTLCELTNPTGDPIRSHGQTPDHPIANALEQLANEYRKTADAQQNIDWSAVEHSESGEPIEKDCHVILHYETITTAESKFEAMHDTMMGNTVVEKALISVIEVSPDGSIEPLQRSYNYKFHCFFNNCSIAKVDSVSQKSAFSESL